MPVRGTSFDAQERVPGPGARLPPGVRLLDPPEPGNIRALEALPPPPPATPTAVGSVSPALRTGTPARDPEAAPTGGMTRAGGPSRSATSARDPDTAQTHGTTAAAGSARTQMRAADLDAASTGGAPPVNGVPRTGTRARDSDTAQTHGTTAAADRARAWTRAADPDAAGTGGVPPVDGVPRTGTRAFGSGANGDDDDDPEVRLPTEPPPLPWALLQPLPFERELSVDGFPLSPAAGALLPPFLAVASRAWISAASDVRLSGLGWTETLVLDHGLVGPRWAVAGRWAPPALSSRPASVGLAGPIVSDGVEGAVSAPRGAWRASGVLGGPLSVGRLGAVLSLDASGVGLPATEPGLAGGGRSRQTLALVTRWVPGTADQLSLLLLAGRRTESPDCFRCTEAAARLDREIALFAGIGWGHTFAPGAGLELRLSLEHHSEAAGALDSTDAPSRLDLSRWITDGAPGPLTADVGASTLEETRSRLRLVGSVHGVLGIQRLEGGVDGWLDAGHHALSLPGGVRFLDRGPDCRAGEAEDCAYRVELDGLDAAAGAWALAAHLEDALRLGDLTVRVGLRLDAAQASAAGSTTDVRLGTGPRLALAWNVGGEGRHWLLAHAGRSHEPDLLAVMARAALPRQRVMAWSDGGFDGCAQPGPGCVQLGGPATVATGGLPRTDEVAVGWRGRPARGLEGGLEGRWRRTSGLWTEEETGLLTDPDGQWTSRDGAWASRRTLTSDARAWRQSLGLGIWARARAGPARVSLVWALTRATGTAAGPLDAWLADPRTAPLAEGPLPDDQRHRVTVSLALFAHPAVELGARLRYATGAPLWETFGVRGSAGLRTVRGARGTGVLSDLPVALRDPDVFTADAWLRLRLGMLFPGALPRLDLTLEAAQVAGGNTPVHLSASAGRLGAVLRREPPFQLVLAVRAGD